MHYQEMKHLILFDMHLVVPYTCLFSLTLVLNFALNNVFFVEQIGNKMIRVSPEYSWHMSMQGYQMSQVI